MKIGYLMQLGVDIRQAPFDGPANHVRHVIEHLRCRGHQVRVLVRLQETIWKSDDLITFEPVPVPRIDRGALRLLERAIRRLQSELKLPYAGFFESVRFALACCQELEGYDLLLERRSWMSYGGVLAARWLRLPIVLEDNGDPLADLAAKGQEPQGLQRRLSLAIMKRATHSAAHIVASGDGWRAACIQRWGLDPVKVTTIENGTVLTEMLQREQLRSFQANDDPKQIPVLVYVGGFYPWHGIPVFLRALAQAYAQGAKARVILIGAGSGMDEARQLSSALGLAECVSFKGQLPTTAYAPYLADADIGLSPYCNWAEFSGLKVLDYKAAGLATIASGRDNQPATLRHGHSGWIVPPCDEAALTEAIVRLTGDCELRRRMGQNARIEAEQLHGWQHTVERLETLFSTLVREA
ncbi:MAG: glycosyltransferase family 4 protein [Caldilineaceae bacterium]|nr:glycosyltransferase family 4 protein [Caldilineaceae bacterium]